MSKAANKHYETSRKSHSFVQLLLLLSLEVLILLSGSYNFPSMLVVRIWRHIRAMSLFFAIFGTWRFDKAIFVTPENKRENQVVERVNLLTKDDKTRRVLHHKRTDIAFSLNSSFVSHTPRQTLYRWLTATQFWARYAPAWAKRVKRHEFLKQ